MVTVEHQLEKTERAYSAQSLVVPPEANMNEQCCHALELVFLSNQNLMHGPVTLMTCNLHE